MVGMRDGAWEKAKRVVCNKESIYSGVQQEWRIQMGQTMPERKGMLGAGREEKKQGVGKHVT